MRYEKAMPALIVRVMRDIFAAFLSALLAAMPMVSAVAAEIPVTPPSAITVRTGDHAGFGRVVLDLPAALDVDVIRTGDGLDIRLPPDATLLSNGPAPRNVRTLAAHPGMLSLTLAPGTSVRRSRLGDRLVLDILDPSPPSRPAPAVGPTRKPNAAAAPPIPSPHDPVPLQPVASASAEPPRPTGREVETASTPSDIPGPVASTPLPPPGPIAIMAAAAPSSAGSELTLPFGPDTGAAAFRRGDLAILVFDERRPIDASLIRKGPAFAQAEVQLLSAATVVRFPVTLTSQVQLARGDQGWMVTIRPGGGRPASAPDLSGLPPDTISTRVADAALLFDAASPGRVVTLPDESSGGTLLVGTQRQSGQGVAVGRTGPGLIVLPTWQGIAIEPVSDSLALRATATGFAASAEGDRRLALDASDDVLDPASRFSRHFDLGAGSAETLERRREAALAVAAATPVLARGPPRLAVARAMIAQGLGVEAQAVAATAIADDPRLGDNPNAIGLGAIAALVAGRPDEAAGIDDPRLDGTDDVTLWRAIRAAELPAGAPSAAPRFAASLPLLAAFPQPLRDRFLPVAVETMLRGGEVAPARAFLATPQAANPALAFARAAALEPKSPDGDVSPALAAFDALAAGDDRLLRVRAARRGIEIRLAAHTVGPAEAADGMERLIAAWRGDRRELAIRLRAAELRRDAGQWRSALSLLRETETAWPDAANDIHIRLRDTFAAALAADGAQPLPPLDMIALAEENADLVSDGTDDDPLAGRLADRLAALDLSPRASLVLERLVAASHPGPVRAEIGAKLARLRLDTGDASGALLALDRSASTPLPTPLEENRLLTGAKALIAQGDLEHAIGLLGQVDLAEADMMTAGLAERSHDWLAAESAWRRVQAKTFPSSGQLDASQAATAIRLAAAAAQAGDEPELAELRRVAPRLAPGDNARIFAVLTEQPVRGTADLVRVAAETALARDLGANGAARDAASSASRPPVRPIAAR